MRKSNLLLAGLLVTTIAATFAAYGDEIKAPDTGKTPSWVEVDEYWWYPLRFDSSTALNEARYFYRRNEESTAAEQLDRAISWLKYAAGHAMPVTKGKLETAASDLTQVADDLRAGEIADATTLDTAVASASNALAEWHYFRAKESYGKKEEGYAAQDLEAAAAHLENAAVSAHYQYGPDTYELFESIYKNGKWTDSEKKVVDHNVLGKDLQAIEKAIKEMGDTLSNTSN